MDLVAETCLFTHFSSSVLFGYLSDAVNNMVFKQVKTFYTGKDHVGDVPLSKKILAAFTTGKSQCWKLQE